MNMTATWFGEDDDVSYPTRLRVVETLGKQFPGFVAPIGFAHRELGYFAAIYLQTQWQHLSGRDHIPLWFFVNYSLTLAPYAYAQEYSANPHEAYEMSSYVQSHQTRNESHAPISVVDTCRAWKEYYSHKTLRLLWRAHTIAIRYALWQYAKEFESVDSPAEEIAFWQGWIRFILGIEKLRIPTNDVYLRDILNLTMPLKAPLDHAYRPTNPIQNFLLRFLMRNALPQKDFIHRYGRRE